MLLLVDNRAGCTIYIRTYVDASSRGWCWRWGSHHQYGIIGNTTVSIIAGTDRLPCCVSDYFAPRPLPLVLPNPRPIPDTVLADGILDVDVLVLVLAPVPVLALPPLVIPPRPRDLVPRAAPRPGAGACLGFSSSSALLRASSRRRSPSVARRSASCCLASASFSISARSCVAPFQFGFSINRWLCSVWERIRVHVFKSVEALPTVFATV